MKKLSMILIALSISQVSFAQDKAEANGNTIIFKPRINVSGCCKDSCKKSKVITKVVEKKVEVVKEVVVEKPVYVYKTTVKKVKQERRKNRISILAGVGPTKLSQPSPSEVDLNRRAVGGLMYQRSLTELLNIGIQGQTNGTVLGVVGFDF